MSQQQEQRQVQAGTIYVALDIEKAGPHPDQPVLAIGAVVASRDDSQRHGLVLLRRSWFMKHPCLDCGIDASEDELRDTGFDLDTWRNFWLGNQAALAHIRANASDEAEQWESFRAFVDSLESLAPPVADGGPPEVVLVSDNPLFDLGQIDLQLFRRFARSSVRYSAQGRYRQVVDPSERLEVMRALEPSLTEALQARVDKTSPLTHRPEDDAMHILATLFALLLYAEHRAAQTTTRRRASSPQGVSSS
jgi:hypothetical protein